MSGITSDQADRIIQLLSESNTLAQQHTAAIESQVSILDAIEGQLSRVNSNLDEVITAMPGGEVPDLIVGTR